MPDLAATTRRAGAPAPDGRKRLLHGRRRGRKLRPGQRSRVAELLPEIEIALPPGGAPLDPAHAFGGACREVWLEIGFGGGEHLIAQAERHPEIGFIGCEPYLNGVARLLAAAEARGLGNVRVFRDDARLLLSRLCDASLARVFILYPDPWPKARHHKRRIVSAPVLAELARVMRPGAELRLATDDRSYLAWMAEHVVRAAAFAWTARRPADWRARPADWPETRYEAKADAAGRRSCYLSFVRRPGGG